MSKSDRDIPTQPFKFESPGKGAYRVRLLGEDVGNTASMILAGADDISSVICPPGLYTAIIEPIGSGETLRQSIELQAGSNTPIKLFDALFNHSAFENATLATPADFPVFTTEQLLGEQVQYKKWNPVTEFSIRPNRAFEKKEIKRSVSEQRGFSLGFSVRHSDDASHRWGPGSLTTSVSDQPGGGVAIRIKTPPDWRKRPVWRLTVAIASDPRWRMRIPLFTGGIQLILTPTGAAGVPDISVGLAPSDAGRAALISNLETLFLGSAREVIRASLPAFREGGGDDNLLAHLIAANEDPWTIAAAAIMLAQSDELVPMADTVLTFAKRWKWLPDAAVVLAWIAARNERLSAEERDLQCLKHLNSLPGRPYFAASQTLGLDLLTGLAMGSSSFAARAAAGNAREKWARLSRRQVKTGPFLAAEDAQVSHNHMLSDKAYAIVAHGTVTPSQIEVQSQTPLHKASDGAPALSRPQLRDNDSWKGRFGGQAERAGFRLEASFSRGPGSWVEVEIIVAGKARSGDAVELFLHDSYQPDRVLLTFSNGRASYKVLAWGGFTVGAWLPLSRTELELDLSEIPDAPTVIRDN